MQRFLADLKRIREARDVSLADIREATRVSNDVLDDFESGALFDRASFNPVYLRSLAKSYARCVGITPVSRVLECMELAQANRYTNELAVDELGEEPLSIAWPDDGDDEPDEDDLPLDSSAFDDPPAPDADSASSDAASTDAEADRAARRWARASSDAAGAAGTAGASADTTATGSSADAASSTASSQRTSEGGIGSGSSRPLIVMGAVFAVLLAGIVWGVMQWRGADAPAAPDTTESNTEAPAPSPDTAAAAPDTPTGPPPPVLGDTLYATLHAVNGPVLRVLIERDDDLRRPYWIEEGDAAVFPFTERIAIEDQFEQFELFINAHPMPLTPRTDAGRRVLTRSDLRTWADTTQSAPAPDLPVPADTLRIP